MILGRIEPEISILSEKKQEFEKDESASGEESMESDRSDFIEDVDHGSECRAERKRTIYRKLSDSCTEDKLM